MSVICVRQSHQYDLSLANSFPVPRGDKTAFICFCSPLALSAEPLVFRHFFYVFGNLGSKRLALSFSSATKLSQGLRKS